MASIINVNAVNLLKFSALGVGIWYGVTRKYTLNLHVKAREEETKALKYKDLVEEGKIVFETRQMESLAKEAKKAHIETLDPNSFKFDAEVAVNWLLAKLESDGVQK